MSKSTNPIVLFVGGLVLGVLIAMGFIMRMKDSDEIPGVVKPLDLFNASRINLSVPSFSLIQRNGGIAAPSAQISVPTENIKTMATSTESHVQIESSLAKQTQLKTKPRWAPGKPGTFGTFDAASANGASTVAVSDAPPSVSKVAPASIEEMTRKEQKQLMRANRLDKQATEGMPDGEGVVASGTAQPTQKQLKQAAILLKRKQQKQQKQQLELDSTAHTTISSSLPTSTVAAAQSQAGTPQSSPSTTSTVQSPITGSSTISSSDSLPAHVQPSTYSSPQIEKAVVAYHAHARMTPFIPSYSAAAAAK